MIRSTLKVAFVATVIGVAGCSTNSSPPAAPVTVTQTAAASASPTTPAHVETVPEMFERVRSGVVRIQTVG